MVYTDSKVNSKSTSNIFTRYRKQNHLKIRDFAKLLGISESALKGYCYGFYDIEDVSYKKIKHFASIMGCTVADIVGSDDISGH